MLRCNELVKLYQKQCVVDHLSFEVRKGEVFALLGSNGSGTITVNGVPLTAYQNIIPVIMIVTNVLGGALAIALSLKTIPNEYERKTSHLIWMRGISQTKYHGSLAAANVLISITAVAMMYMGTVLYTLLQGKIEGAFRCIPAFFITAISVTIVSLLASALSIKLPSLVAGSLTAVVYVFGILHGILDTYRGMIEGFTSSVLKAVLLVIPDLNSLQNQAANLLLGKDLEWHTIIKGLWIIYLLTLLFIVFRREEA